MGKQQRKQEKTSKKWANLPVSMDEIVSVNIHGIGSSGEGVGQVQDFTVFVPFTYYQGKP